MSEKLSSRPEAPWALWTGIAGGIATAVVSVMGILKSGSSTAAIGFISWTAGGSTRRSNARR